MFNFGGDTDNPGIVQPEPEALGNPRHERGGGRVRSGPPVAIDAVQELIRSKGGSGDDVPKLPRGQFYVRNTDAHPAIPIKVAIPLCLSRHPPDQSLDEAQILQKAAASWKRLNP